MAFTFISRHLSDGRKKKSSLQELDPVFWQEQNVQCFILWLKHIKKINKKMKHLYMFFFIQENVAVWRMASTRLLPPLTKVNSLKIDCIRVVLHFKRLNVNYGTFRINTHNALALMCIFCCFILYHMHKNKVGLFSLFFPNLAYLKSWTLSIFLKCHTRGCVSKKNHFRFYLSFLLFLSTKNLT